MTRWRKIKERRSIRRSVGRSRRGKSRTEIRGLFEEEMARREVPIDPLWIEGQVRAFEHSALARILEAGRGIRDFRRALRAEERPGLRLKQGTPVLANENTRPRARSRHVSARKTRLSSGWATVKLTPSVSPVLDQIYASSVERVGEIATTAVLLKRPDNQTDENACFAIYIGGEYVGLLDDVASSRFQEFVDDAGKRSETPSVTGYLTRAADMQPPFLLALRLP